MNRRRIIALLLGYLARLRFRSLFLLAAGLFVVDLFVPDAVPFADEILLGFLALLLARWKKPNGGENP
jgi:hypothetical protein